MTQDYPIIQDLSSHRGDPKSFIETDYFDGFVVEGDYTAHKIRFAVKLNASDSDRIFTKGNLIDGGDDTQIETSFDGTYTTIIPKILATDTEAETNTYNFYEIIAINASDTSDKITLFKGIFKLYGDIIRPNDTTGGSALGYNYYTNQDLIGTKDGVNLIFTVGKAILTNSEIVSMGNTRLIRDVHYSIAITTAETTITIIEGTYMQAPTALTPLVIDYVGA